MSKPKNLEARLDLFKKTVTDLREQLDLSWEIIREELAICPSCGHALKRLGRNPAKRRPTLK